MPRGQHAGQGEGQLRGQLAGDLGATSLLKQADVPHITVVLGATDSAALLSALHANSPAPIRP